MVTLQFMKRYPIGNVSQTETLLTGFDKKKKKNSVGNISQIETLLTGFEKFKKKKFRWYCFTN